MENWSIREEGGLKLSVADCVGGGSEELVHFFIGGDNTVVKDLGEGRWETEQGVDRRYSDQSSDAVAVEVGACLLAVDDVVLVLNDTLEGIVVGIVAVR